MQISDVTAVITPDTFERPIYAGNALQTIQSRDAKKVITVRTASFKGVAEGRQRSYRDCGSSCTKQCNAICKEELSVSARPELTAAKLLFRVVVH